MKLTKQIMATLIDCFAIIVVWLIPDGMVRGLIGVRGDLESRMSEQLSKTYVGIR